MTACLTTPGSWLFERRNLAWLQDPALTAQLPACYRAFAAYCASGLYRRAAAEAFLRSVIALRRKSGRDGIAPLRLAASFIYLDLHDPRFLRVPIEVDEAAAQLAPLLRKGDTFIDSGANHGAFSLAAAKLIGPDGYIVAIEPQPRLTKAVEATLQHAGVPFEVQAVALGNRSGSATLFRQWASSGSAGLVAGFSAVSRHRSFHVPIARMDDLFAGRTFPGRILWKLDIEGSELACLQGASRFLELQRPWILMEVNPKAMGRAGTTLEDLVTELEPSGYRFSERNGINESRSLRELRFASDQLASNFLASSGDHREILLRADG